MLVSFESRVGYHEVILKGAFSDREAADISTRFEAFLAGAPPEESAYACVLFNLRDATMISRRVFSVIAGYAVLLRLRGKGTVLAHPTEAVRGFIEESRTQSLLQPARDEAEAFQLMVGSVHREYTPDFFAFLVNGQYLTKDQLRQLTAEHRAQGGRISMERLLVDFKIFSWKTLLAAHVRYRLHKNPLPSPQREFGEPAVSDAEGVPRGLFGAPAVLPPGKPAPRPDAPPLDAFEAAAQAKAAILEAEAPAPESEFVQPRLLGTILVELKILSQDQLRQALERQREEGRRAKLGDLLVRMGLVTDDQLFRALEHQFKRKRPSAPAPGQKSEFVRKQLLGEILLELGLLDERALKQALEAQRNSPSREKLGSVLLRLGLVTREQIFTALEAQANRKAPRPNLEVQR